MSVLTYIYPRDTKPLALDSLRTLLSLEGFTVTEVEENARGRRTWSYLLVSHESSKNLRFRVVAAQNHKANINWVVDRYPTNPNLDVVRNAKDYMWCQIESGAASDRELMGGFAFFDSFVRLIARETKGVVDLPENERLFSASGFSRHCNAKSKRTAKSQ